MNKITQVSEFPKLENVFADVLENAKKIEASTPVKMGGAGALDLIYNICEHLQATKVLIADNSAFMDYCMKNNHQPIIMEFDGKYAELILK